MAIFRPAPCKGCGLNTQVDHAQRLYAALAPSYDNETRFIAGIRSQAIEALHLRVGETVLDAGCGTGWCLPMLAERVGQAGKVIGFEPSPDMLALAAARINKRGLGNTRLLHADGDTVVLDSPPDAILFSYTHDLIRSRSALAHIFSQATPGTRIVATGTKLFPKWFFPGNWYLRYTHRVTITNFESLERPWTLLGEYCEKHNVKVTVPGSRYIFTGTLR